MLNPSLEDIAKYAVQLAQFEEASRALRVLPKLVEYDTRAIREELSWWVRLRRQGCTCDLGEPGFLQCTVDAIACDGRKAWYQANRPDVEMEKV